MGGEVGISSRKPRIKRKKKKRKPRINSVTATKELMSI